MPVLPTAVSHLIPKRDALFVEVDLSDYLIDYYVHRRNAASAEHDDELKELIACFAVHLSTKPPGDHYAWTLHLVSGQPYSLFVTGSAGAASDKSGDVRGYIVGNVITEFVRHTDTNLLHAESIDRRGNKFTSHVQCESSSISEVVEHFYEMSEQNKLKISHVPASDRSVALAGLPGCKQDWFEAAEPLELNKEESKKDFRKMRTCFYEFRCDCSPEKLLPFFRSLTSEELEDLYGSDEQLLINCPRCGKRFTIRRSETGRASLS